MTSQQVEEAVLGRCSTFDEDCVRAGTKVEYRLARYETLAEVDAWCRGGPYMARLDFTCPTCGQGRLIACRGATGAEAREAMVAEVARHGLVCDGFLGEPEDYEYL